MVFRIDATYFRPAYSTAIIYNHNRLTYEFIWTMSASESGTSLIANYECFLCQEIIRDLSEATKHLRSSHGKTDGETLHCMKLQRNDMFCGTTFTSFKAMRKHMKENKCKLLSHDVKLDQHHSKNDDNSNEGWNVLIDDFGDLNVKSNVPGENVATSLEECISSFVNRLIVAKLPHHIVNDILDCSKELTCKITAIIKESIRSVQPAVDVDSILDSTEKIVTSHLNKFNTRYARKKHFENSAHYVAPKTISVNGDETFQYVPILNTLKNLFSIEDFRKEYFAYNKSHDCKVDVYERYCCGKNYKNSKFFLSHENNIQIQIYFDDVQLTSPLKTKPHSICGIYFIVRNIPPNFTSKLDNIYLVALCDTEIVKKNGCNSILKQFVDDIRTLETEGLEIYDEDNRKKIVLRGTLVQVSFDNLGGNTIFGLVKSFNSIYYCRICICSKENCKKKTSEMPDKIRTREHYNEQITKLRQSEDKCIKLKLCETYGITSYSALNDLNFFHTVENRSQDLMHDVYEGAMPFILRHFFAHMIEHGIITGRDIEEKIQTFDYGILASKTTPSKLCLKKKNLNQNASQMHSLMTHIPFIFIDLLQLEDKSKKTVVHGVWPVIEYMLKIDQVISSTVITETDLISLEKYTDEFLTNIQTKFKVDLIPKLHFLTHYANTIRAMGPVTYLQMMRGDAKHQPFTQYAKRCKNYRNICKTLSEKHQEVLAAKCRENSYRNRFETSKKMVKVENKNGILLKQMENHSKLLYEYFGAHINRIMILNSIVYNTFIFRKGLFLILSNAMHQIDAVIKFNDSLLLLCTTYNTVKFYKFANCFEIKKSSETFLIEIDKLVCMRTYEAKILNNQPQIIADNLDLIPIYEDYIK